MTPPATRPAFEPPDDKPDTRRSRQKSDRRSQLLSAAAHLMAERGFLAVRLEDIGSAAGVSGPAIYRHFPKEAMLVELLVESALGCSRGACCRRRDTRPDSGPERPHRLPPRLHARRTRSDPNPGSRPRPPTGVRPAAGPTRPTALRRDLGRRTSPAEPPTGRGRCASHGTRRVRTAQPRRRTA